MEDSELERQRNESIPNPKSFDEIINETPGCVMIFVVFWGGVFLILISLIFISR